MVQPHIFFRRFQVLFQVVVVALSQSYQCQLSVFNESTSYVLDTFKVRIKRIPIQWCKKCTNSDSKNIDEEFSLLGLRKTDIGIVMP